MPDPEIQGPESLATRALAFLFYPRAAAEPAEQRRWFQLGWIDWIVLVLYTAVLGYAIPHHIASDDEAQAWLLGRDSSFHDLFFIRMHYEGGAALWPMLMRVAHLLHVPFQAISWIGATVAVAGIAVWLAASPLPRVYRWLLPFTFFLQYQYAVIARPYTLFPLLLFVLCIVFTQSRPRPLVFAVAAGLMTNISLHAALLAGFFALLFWRRLRSLPMEDRPSRPRFAAAVTLFLCFGLFSALAAFPAPDVCTDAIVGDTTGTSHPFLRSLLPVNRLPEGAPPLDSFIHPDLIQLHGPDAPEMPEPTTKPNPLAVFIVKSIFVGSNAAFFPLSTNNLFALGFLVSLFFWLRKRGGLVLMLPYLLTILIAAQILILDHHSGLLALTLVAVIWIALKTTPAPAKPSAWATPALYGLALLIIVQQIGWSFSTIHSEAHQPYDPGLATANYIKQHLAGKKIVGIGYATVTTQAYFPQSIFINQQHAYWLWSAPVFINRRRTEALNMHPDAVVIEDFISGAGFFSNQIGFNHTEGAHAFTPQRRFWERHGYHVAETFCGERYFRDSSTHSACELVMLPN